MDDNTVDFIGHALALYLDENYLDEPALDFVKRMKVISPNTSPSIKRLIGHNCIEVATADLINKDTFYKIRNNL